MKDVKLTDRFIERVISLKGDRSSLEVAYGPFDSKAYETVKVEPWFAGYEIEQHVKRLQLLLNTELVRLGARLGSVLLPPKLRVHFLKDLTTARTRGQLVRVRVLDTEADIGDWPWEYICLDEVEGGFLALDPHCSISRLQPLARESATLPIPAPFELKHHEPLRVLIVYADPKIPGFLSVGADPQVRGLLETLKQFPGSVEVRRLYPFGRVPDDEIATRNNLSNTIQQWPAHIIIVLAHGWFLKYRQEGAIFLETESGFHYDRILAAELAAILEKNTLPCLVLLDCCRSASRGQLSSGRSVAGALTAPGRAVIGMQFPWPFAACIPFTVSLFSVLTAPSSLDDALLTARTQIQLNDPERAEWGCPVLYRSETPPPPALPAKRPNWFRELDRFLDSVHGELADEDLDSLLKIMTLKEALRAKCNEILTTNPSLYEFVVGDDPLYRMLAGTADDALVETDPVWFTHLLAPPDTFSWRKHSDGGPWHVSVRTASGELLRTTVDQPFLEVPSAVKSQWPDGFVLWEVKQERLDGADGLVQGICGILPSPEQTRVNSETEKIKRDRSGPVAELNLARCYSEFRLYTAAIALMEGLLKRSPQGVTGFAAHRMLAMLYGAVEAELASRDGFENEVIWSNSLARWHVEAAFAASDTAD